ncbi:MBL fold metallo-hydrolase, partial [Streptomyces sp. SID3343]|nr:MBL fold metallo-hydrolase [Streptomyces sp. SID3343]
MLMCVAAGGTVAGLRTAADRSGPIAESARRGGEAVVELSVRSDPERRLTRVRGSELGAPPTVFAARIEQVDHTRVRTPVAVLATGPEAGSWLGLLPSTRVRVHGRFVSGKGGSALLLVRGAPEQTAGAVAHQRFAGRLRARLRDACADLPPAARGLLPGLVVGDTSRLPADLEADFKTTELTHLTAVSGTNITILLGFVLFLLRRGGLHGRVLPVVGAITVAAFVVVARPEPSVLRAAAMGLVTLVALYTGRTRRGLPALAVAVLGLVLLDPTLARSYGFALSVLATGALLLLAPHWTRRLRARGWPKWAAVVVAVPLAAQAVCGPLVVTFAGRVSLVAVPCNLLAEFAVAPATVLGFVTLVLASVWLPLARVVAWLASWPVGWIAGVARTGAGLPGAAVTWPPGVLGGVALAAITAAAIPVLRVLRRDRSHPARRRTVPAWPRALGSALLAGVAVLVLLRPPTLVQPLTGWPPPDWHLVMCQVGQGDAIVLNAGAGAGVLVDAGPDPLAVDRCLRDLGIHRLPLVVLTHFHADHVEGLPGALRGRAVGEIQGTALAEPAGEVARVRRWAAAAGLSPTIARDGERRAVANLTWQVLAPPPTDTGGSAANNASVVLLAQRRGVRLLLTGDVETEAQTALRPRLAGQRVDVLKVPHHGSARQDPALLRALRPRLALISVGRDNPYGHPSRATRILLTTTGTKVLRTDTDGPIAITGSPTHLKAVARGPNSDSQAASTDQARPGPSPSPPQRPSPPSSPSPGAPPTTGPALKSKPG